MTLAQVKLALGAKHVIRVCSSKDQQKVLHAAQRLLDNASVIRAAVDLSGVELLWPLVCWVMPTSVFLLLVVGRLEAPVMRICMCPRAMNPFIHFSYRAVISASGWDNEDLFFVIVLRTSSTCCCWHN